MSYSGFGLCNIKKEGCAMHPDDIETDLTDAQYERQLRAYLESTGDDINRMVCVRTNILEAIKESQRR